MDASRGSRIVAEAVKAGYVRRVASQEDGRRIHPELTPAGQAVVDATRRTRAEQALISVVATAYLLGVSTRRVEGLVQTLGIEKLSRSQVSDMAKHLDAEVQAFRSRPLDAGPYTYLWIDALVVKVREDGRTQNVSVMLATAVNRDGQREILGLDVDALSDVCARASEEGVVSLANLNTPTQTVISGEEAGVVRAMPSRAIV